MAHARIPCQATRACRVQLSSAAHSSSLNIQASKLQLHRAVQLHLHSVRRLRTRPDNAEPRQCFTNVWKQARIAGIKSRQSELGDDHLIQQQELPSANGSRLQCKTSASLEAVTAEVERAHNPHHQTNGGQNAGDFVSAGQEQKTRGREESGTAPLLEAVALAAGRHDVSFGYPRHRKGVGAPEELMEALSPLVFKHDVSAFQWLPNPEGPLEAAEQLAAAAFGADRTFFLVNGSTCGIHAAVMATCRPGDTLILPRNCHQSAVSAMVLSGARPSYLLPNYDRDWTIALGVPPLEVERALREARENDQTVGAVLIVSPTYHGVCNNLRSIAAICHDFGVPLLVDEAHGGHFKFHPAFPDAALECGADVAVQSTHKVLSGFTQAAMLHLRGDRVPEDRLRRSLQLLQTPRRSHLLLSSLDAARLETTRQRADGVNGPLNSALRLANRARGALSALPGVQVLDAPGMDPLRVAVNTTGLGLSGYEADETLVEQFGVIAELPCETGLVFALGPGSREDNVKRLVDACTSLAGRVRETEQDAKESGEQSVDFGCDRGVFGEARMTPREAFFSESERVPAAAAVGRVCAELLCPYPPGIPVLTPGEIISATAIELLTSTLQSRGTVTGAGDPSLKTIAVTCDVPRHLTAGSPATDPHGVSNSKEQTVEAFEEEPPPSIKEDRSAGLKGLDERDPAKGRAEPLDQNQAPLWEAVAAAARRDDAPFYFPGHKKGQGVARELKDLIGATVFLHDLPEIPGLDNLASPEGPILEAQRLAAAAFGADRTWFLINGATCGAQAAVLATCRPGDALILSSSYAQSAHSALVLSGARPVYVASDAGPEWAPERGVRPEAILRALQNARAAGETVGAVLIASPTSYGVCSDVTSIADVCHSCGVPLLVDESRGAHFGFHRALPRAALSCGADVVIQATYEGLSALTQAAMLHVKGDRVAACRVDRSLQTLQSSSPSYILLISLDLARRNAALQDQAGDNLTLGFALQVAAKARTKLFSLPGITVLEAPELDPLRVTVTTEGLRLTGHETEQTLRVEFGVISALPFPAGVSFAFGVGSTDEDLDRLVGGLRLLSEAANGGPPLVKRSDVRKDLVVLEEECLGQLDKWCRSWKNRLPALLEPFENEWEEFCGADSSAQMDVGRRMQRQREMWQNRRDGGENRRDGRSFGIETRDSPNGLSTARDTAGEAARDTGGVQPETNGKPPEVNGTPPEADKIRTESANNAGTMPRQLDRLYIEGREDLRAWLDSTAATLDATHASRSKQVVERFVGYRKANEVDFEDTSAMRAAAGALLASIAESTRELPAEIGLPGLKEKVRRAQIKVAEALMSGQGTERRQTEGSFDGTRKWTATGGVRSDFQAAGIGAECGETETEDPFALTEVELARAKGTNGRRTSRTGTIDFAEVFAAEGKATGGLNGSDLVFETAKRGYLEAANLVAEASHVMAYGSGRRDCQGPLTGPQKGALSRNESVAAALECATEDLTLIRCFGGSPPKRSRRLPPESSVKRELEDALDLELRKASRVTRYAQEQLQEVLEGLEHAAGGACEEDTAARRNDCVLRHVTSALEHLRRAVGGHNREHRRRFTEEKDSLGKSECGPLLDTEAKKDEDTAGPKKTPRFVFFEFD